MKKSSLFCFAFLLFTLTFQSQSVTDLFTRSETKIYWLGIDFTHLKLVGDFNQFAEAGGVATNVIKSKYFPGWNNLILSEKKKYDVDGMIRKRVIYNIDAINGINSTTATEQMESETEPEYTKDQIQGFIKNYDFGVKEGIGILFFANSLNKQREKGKFHFVAINLSNNEILLQELLDGKPGGIGLRNYWARCISEIIIEIREHKFRKWKRDYRVKNDD